MGGTTTAFFVFSHHCILMPKEIHNKGKKLAKALSRRNLYDKLHIRQISNDSLPTLPMDVRLRSTILRCTYPALPYLHHLPLWTDTQGAHHWPHACNGNFPRSVGYLSLPCTHHTAAYLFPFRPNFEKRARVRELAVPHCVLGHVVISGKAWELWSVMYHIEKKTSHTLGLPLQRIVRQKGRRPISVQQGSFWRFLLSPRTWATSTTCQSCLWVHAERGELPAPRGSVPLKQHPLKFCGYR